jgi:hypothetical protein
MQKCIFIVLFFLILLSNIVNGFDHSVYDTLLRKRVENGLVDYKGIKQNPEHLEKYLNQLKNVDPDSFQTWSKDAKKAFWINAYNAITLKGIVEQYPIEYGGFLERLRFPKNSIRQINDFWNTVFVPIMGKALTLDDIEHKILRKRYDDPRIHFVLVCASLGCPILESNAFTAETLDTRLDSATHRFIRNTNQVRVDKDENVLYLSSILDWYKEDFRYSEKVDLESYNNKTKGIVEFVMKYISESNADYIKENQPEIKYLDYDWSLNEQQ